MKSIVYTRPVYYYETDRMQIVHHSNYIRWMEEIRIAFMREQQIPYDKLEQEGIMLPVLGVNCQYHIPFQFGDTFSAICHITAYTGVRLSFGYEIYKQGDSHCCITGSSDHCFTNENRKPIRLQRLRPELHMQFCNLIEP